jgi:hypothetical protein
MTSITSFEAILTQQNTSAYLANFTGTATEDNVASNVNGYIFDMFASDVSMTVDPSFAIAVTPLLGHPAVDAIAEVSYPATTFDDLISVVLDSADISDNDISDVKFVVNSINPFSNIVFSDSAIKNGAENITYLDQSLPSDMVRHIAKDVTGGYAVADIFTNESELRNGIIALDSELSQDISGDIDLLHTFTNVTNSDGVDMQTALASDTNDLFFTSAHTLFQLTMSASIADASGRWHQFLYDLSNNATIVTGPGTSVAVGADDVTSDHVEIIKVPLKFLPGDAIAIRVQYDPGTNNPPLGSNVITPRSYKLLVSLT